MCEIDPRIADAIQMADMQCQWMDERDPITDKQKKVLRQLLIWHHSGGPAQEIACRVVDGKLVYWLRDDYINNRQKFIGEVFYIIDQSGKLLRHWVPGGWRCVKLQALIDNIRRLGPVCERLIPNVVIGTN